MGLLAPIQQLYMDEAPVLRKGDRFMNDLAGYNGSKYSSPHQD